MPTRIQDLSNTDLSALSGSNNKNVMRYNASSGKFDVVNINTIIGLTTSLPQSFIDVVESKVDITEIADQVVDGGGF